ncbi:hypothetical protein DITRI_Ditri06bG0156100 [Diplodiscus trichospermus]
MSEIADPCEEWALISQTAALVAEIVRREGLNLWQELLPSLVSIPSEGPVQAELVSMMLRWLSEDITVHDEDLEGFIYLKHFGATLNEVSRQQLDVAKQHAAAVTASVNAVNAYGESFV